MHYYVDAYNLLFRKFSGFETLEFSREELIDLFLDALSKLNLNITLVFDAHCVDNFTRTHIQDLEIVYTDFNQTADEYIISALEHCKYPKSECVISSDKHLTRISRSLGAQSQSVEEFVQWLQKKLKHSSSKQSSQRHSAKRLKQSEPTDTSKKTKKKNSPKNKDPDFELLAPINSECTSLEMFQYYLDIFEGKLDNDEENKY
ncbi:Uncharacterized protein SCG7109_BJ_00050 [Chlamydiales bacterium SCGC AG-110-M15]|nr:Uncharacterized protein SCG7109_BJ_00050 [Chlamydiales bacterium SCGC AG-110-M15]